MHRRTVLAGLCSAALLFSTGLSLAQDISAAKKIVSIGGSVTEIVYALEEEGRLVARDTTSVFPEQAHSLPDVGYMRQLSAEGVLSVGPDAIIAIEGSGPQDTVTLLGQANVPFVTVPEKHSAGGVVEKVEIIGRALGVSEKADKLASELREKLDAAAKASEAIAPAARRKVMFVLSVQNGRLMASGTGSAADAMIKMAGGVNAFPDYKGYKSLSDEAIIAAAPDVIVLMDRGGGDVSGATAILANPAVSQTPAGKEKRLVVLDGAFLLGFGPRTPEAIMALTDAIYGEHAAAMR
ncbi:heme/hemin ABC transporter substrate-binding protein [Limoniibacter endophyticus]|uniref:Hemin ABC transporter substrate-binding protein n=1 Tax=Limoniibacter endophyticus TaxID=1565040 RepID=A0A8J3GH00_9HYPH|nr:ABC transporter substrate-binding protein [Limoniibacter endophyticus]GHC75740.1 hemin ABC transporter substrate-binding protein [Limoniibacter endophyticus]